MKTIRKYTVPHKENDYRPYLLRTAGIVLILFFLIGGLFLSRLQILVINTSNFIATVLPAVLVDLANSDRAGNALSSLSINQKLVEAAQLKANDMAAKSYFSHNTPEGFAPWYWFKKVGYDFIYAGENLAVFYDDSNAVNEAWMNSPGHRANILNGHFTEVGIATAQGVYQGYPTTFVVQMFGSAMPNKIADATEPIETSDESPVIPEQEPTYQNVASSAVLGETSQQTFISVENADVIAAAVQDNQDKSKTVRYSNPAARLLTSPSQVLKIFYFLIIVMLCITLCAVLIVRHEHRPKHAVYASLLVIAVISIYYGYKAIIFSQIVVL